MITTKDEVKRALMFALKLADKEADEVGDDFTDGIRVGIHRAIDIVDAMEEFTVKTIVAQ